MRARELRDFRVVKRLKERSILYTVGEGGLPPEMDVVIFRPMQVDDDRYFYECNDCGMCGCPSFEMVDTIMGIPTEIMIFMQDHVEFCGIVLSVRAKDKSKV